MGIVGGYFVGLTRKQASKGWGASVSVQGVADSATEGRAAVMSNVEIDHETGALAVVISLLRREGSERPNALGGTLHGGPAIGSAGGEGGASQRPGK